ncbi:NAD(P)-binding protein [Hypoxylon crocopeplum]|nr:NAD(P)-binding protein [Hypoxylon crocopeplum]
MSIVLIIGAGPNVGQSCADVFANAGFQVAVASRTRKLDAKYRHYVFDAYKPETVPALFEQVSSELGAPSVVIYNAYAHEGTPKDNPFAQDIETLQKNSNVNTISPYLAAREAVKCFEKLGSSGLGPSGATFIFTGNLLNQSVIAGLMPFGMGKTTTAYMIQHLALAAYDGKPYKFYYADERHEDGSFMTYDLNGDAHADAYLELASDSKQRAWDYTFVKGKGYVEFARQEIMQWSG